MEWYLSFFGHSISCGYVMRLPSAAARSAVHAVAFLGIAAIVPPRELIQITIKTLVVYKVVNAEHLPLEVRPCAFQPVDVAEVVTDVLAEAVVDSVVVEPALQPM